MRKIIIIFLFVNTAVLNPVFADDVQKTRSNYSSRTQSPVCLPSPAGFFNKIGRKLTLDTMLLHRPASPIYNP